MTNNAIKGETPEFWDRPAVLEFFGGVRPLHTSTLYRGIHDGTYPRPVKVSRSAVRWLASECREAAQRMIGERDKPVKPGKRRGRPRKGITQK
jgi:predicted DNA-binding transcriptional regulator AlpA